jgi:acyl carrier protein
MGSPSDRTAPDHHRHALDRDAALWPPSGLYCVEKFRHGDTCMQRQKQSHRIKQYILKNFLFSNDDSAIGDQDSLVRGGILDSTGIYELIMFIEEEFKFTIAPEEMTPDNFDTLEVIDAFIDRKLAG